MLPRCGSGDCGAYVMGRYTPTYNSTYYRVGAVQGQGRSTVFLRAHRNDGTSISADLNTGIPASDGVVLRERVQFLGANPTTIRARVWLDGTPEPSTWLLDTTDSTPAEQTPGMVGTRMRSRRFAGSLAPVPAGHAPLQPVDDGNCPPCAARYAAGGCDWTAKSVPGFGAVKPASLASRMRPVEKSTP